MLTVDGIDCDAYGVYIGAMPRDDSPAVAADEEEEEEDLTIGGSWKISPQHISCMPPIGDRSPRARFATSFKVCLG